LNDHDTRSFACRASATHCRATWGPVGDQSSVPSNATVSSRTFLSKERSLWCTRWHPRTSLDRPRTAPTARAALIVPRVRIQACGFPTAARRSVGSGCLRTSEALCQNEDPFDKLTAKPRRSGMALKGCAEPRYAQTPKALALRLVRQGEGARTSGTRKPQL